MGCRVGADRCHTLTSYGQDLPRKIGRALFAVATAQPPPPSACDPQVRTIRFNAVHGGPLGQHKLSGLVGGLLRLSSNTPASAKRSALPDNAECRPPDAIVSASAG